MLPQKPPRNKRPLQVCLSFSCLLVLFDMFPVHQPRLANLLHVSSFKYSRVLVLYACFTTLLYNIATRKTTKKDKTRPRDGDDDAPPLPSPPSPSPPS